MAVTLPCARSPLSREPEELYVLLGTMTVHTLPRNDDLRQVQAQSQVTHWAAAQEVAFFDLPENASGAQSTRLAGDTAAIRGAVGDQLGAVAQSLTTFVAGAGPATRLPRYCVGKLRPFLVPSMCSAGEV